MGVKRSHSASRVLSVVELIAAHQPIGVSALARLLQDDKSAVQRAVMTLADAGWIRMAPAAPVRWELSAHIFTIAHLPQSANDLRQRARRTLEALRDQSGETVFLAIPDIERFVIIDVAESPHPLRAPLQVGEVISVRGSATGRAMLPYLSPERLSRVLGGQTLDASDRAELDATQARGFGLSVDTVMAGTTIVAAPIFDSDGQPIASIGVSGLSDRITPSRREQIGALAVAGARSLSRGAPKVPASSLAEPV